MKDFKELKQQLKAAGEAIEAYMNETEQKSEKFKYVVFTDFKGCSYGLTIGKAYELQQRTANELFSVINDIGAVWYFDSSSYVFNLFNDAPPLPKGTPCLVWNINNAKYYMKADGKGRFYFDNNIKESIKFDNFHVLENLPENF